MVASGSLITWVVLIAGFLLLWTSMQDETGVPPWLAMTTFGAGIAGLVAWMVRGFRRVARDAKRINAAVHDLGVGELPKEALVLEAKTPIHRAHAAHVLAEAALRRGDAAQALEECDRGWANGFPNTHTVFRVHLLSCLRAWDQEGAARAVEGRDPSVALPARDEALAEMARFVGRPAARTSESGARLRAELRRDASLGAWVDAMAPKLLRTFERAAAELDAGTGARAP
jgi:hypothetical protein